MRGMVAAHGEHLKENKMNQAARGSAVMLDRVKLSAKAGVTLVELLVVMLIVVILAVSLTPLFRDYIVRAQYAADAVPAIGDLRTKIELFKYDNSFLPGLPRDLNGPTQNTSELTDNGVTSFAQTFALATVNGVEVWRPGIIGITAGNPPSYGTATALTTPANIGIHFATDLNVNYENFSGSRLRPNHVLYYAARGDAGHTDPQAPTAATAEPGYMYVVAVLGDNRLPAGSGYAVLELHNPLTETKIVATWERFRERGLPVGRVVLAGAEHGGSAQEAADNNICWMGNVGLLLSNGGDPASPDAVAALSDVEAGLADLRTAGWKF